MSHYFVSPEILERFKDINLRLKALSNTQGIPLFTVATLPATTTGAQIVYVSDATAGNRYKGWDATAGAWVSLG